MPRGRRPIKMYRMRKEYRTRLDRRLTKRRTPRSRLRGPLEAQPSRYRTLPDRLPIKPDRPLKTRQKPRARLPTELEAPTEPRPNPTA